MSQHIQCEAPTLSPPEWSCRRFPSLTGAVVTLLAGRERPVADNDHALVGHALLRPGLLVLGEGPSEDRGARRGTTLHHLAGCSLRRHLGCGGGPAPTDRKTKISRICKRLLYFPLKGQQNYASYMWEQTRNSSVGCCLSAIAWGIKT